jgi:FHS family L-fucose permease-like MFS transporter
MPMLMGWIGDHYGMTAGFLMPLGCFAVIGAYALGWAGLSKSDGLVGVSTVKGH